MKRSNVRVGGEYLAKLKGQEVRVRIDAARSNGGWDATILETQKSIRIKSPRALEPIPGDANEPTEEPMPKTIERLNRTATKSSAAPTPKKLSALDAAAKVLAEASGPMTTKQMIEAMSAQGLWTSPGGKTPGATLYSAILREMTSKGADARFTKTQRGSFAVRS